MRRYGIFVGTLIAAVLFAGSEAVRGRIDLLVGLDNESVRVVLLTYQPGADPDIHLNPGPEITILQEGELALYIPKGRVALLITTGGCYARNQPLCAHPFARRVRVSSASSTSVHPRAGGA